MADSVIKVTENDLEVGYVTQKQGKLGKVYYALTSDGKPSMGTGSKTIIGAAANALIAVTKQARKDVIKGLEGAYQLKTSGDFRKAFLETYSSALLLTVDKQLQVYDNEPGFWGQNAKAVKVLAKINQNAKRLYDNYTQANKAVVVGTRQVEEYKAGFKQLVEKYNSGLIDKKTESQQKYEEWVNVFKKGLNFLEKQFGVLEFDIGQISSAMSDRRPLTRGLAADAVENVLMLMNVNNLK